MLISLGEHSQCDLNITKKKKKKKKRQQKNKIIKHEFIESI